MIKRRYHYKSEIKGLEPTPLNLFGLEVRFMKAEQMIRNEQEIRKQCMKRGYRAGLNKHAKSGRNTEVPHFKSIDIIKKSVQDEDEDHEITSENLRMERMRRRSKVYEKEMFFSKIEEKLSELK